ncbi:hypothetical protein [Sorangium sp. So ce1024]
MTYEQNRRVEISIVFKKANVGGVIGDRVERVGAATAGGGEGPPR